MTIAEVEPQDVLAESCRALGISPSHDHKIEDDFLTALLRHSAGFLCPCSAATLRSTAAESLQRLVEDEDLVSRIENVIEGLVMVGDLLELNQVTTDDPAVKGTWLFAAPPTYIVRPSGSIFLTGIVADQDTYLPHGLASRIRTEGYARTIVPEPDEDLSGELAELGLQEITQDNWLKSPKEQTPEDLHSRMVAKFRAQSRSGAIPDLQLLDPTRPVTYYTGRWARPKKQTGTFVGRRPQEYGAPIWCFVELENGEATKLLDLPLAKSQWRGCDAAWHLQMAIDHSHDTPQLYRLLPDNQGHRLDFFSPLPAWAQRRLMIVGHPIPPDKCLLSYWVPGDELEEEEQYLQKRLWLARQEKESRS